MRRVGLAGFVAGALLFLAGCGGGDDGGSSNPVPPDNSTPAGTTFPVFQLWVAALNTSETKSFTISGSVEGTSVSGSGSATFGSPRSAIFESKAALAKTTFSSGTIVVSGQSAPVAATSTLYVDSNYQPLGQTSSDLYAVVSGVVTIPQTAKVNDTGRLYEAIRYTNATKSVRLGTATVEYALQPDTSATTALMKLVITNKSTTGAVEATSVETYRIFTSGSLTRLSEQVIAGASSLTITYGP